MMLGIVWAAGWSWDGLGVVWLMGVHVAWDGGAWRLEMAQWLPRPVGEVFPFFSDAYNLERLTPGILRFEVLTPRPIVMRSGALIDYKLRVRGVPIRWRTEILEWDPPRGFVDTQLRGPYALWHHTHRFESRDGGTLCTDVVRYRPRGWLLAGLVNRLLVERDVRAIFAYRAARLGEVFGDRRLGLGAGRLGEGEGDRRLGLGAGRLGEEDREEERRGELGVRGER